MVPLVSSEESNCQQAHNRYDSEVHMRSVGGKTTLTNVIQPDGVQTTRNLSTSRQHLWYVWVFPLACLVDAVSQAHQTDSISGSAIDFIRNTKFHARNAHVTNADRILSERAAGCAAVTESSVEGG